MVPSREEEGEEKKVEEKKEGEEKGEEKKGEGMEEKESIRESEYNTELGVYHENEMSAQPTVSPRCFFLNE